MSNTAILPAFQKLRHILSFQEKKKLLGVSIFALIVALMELVITAVIVLFAQAMSNPAQGVRYFSKIGIEGVSPSRAVFYMALICGAIYVLRGILGVGEIFYRSLTIKNLQCGFQSKMLSLYENLNYKIYVTRNASKGVNVVAVNAGEVFSSGVQCIFYIVSEALIFLILIFAVIFINPILSLTLVVFGGFMLYLTKKYALPYFYQWGTEYQSSSLETGKNLLQFFHAFKEIVLLKKAQFFIQSFQKQLRIQTRARTLREATEACPRIILETLLVLIFVGVIAFMCYRHDSPTQMIGVIGGYLYMGFRVMPGINRMISYVALFKSNIPHINSLYDELHLLEKQENYEDHKDFQFEEKLSFRDVKFRYLNTDVDVLQGISFDIRKGEKIGIIGKTGSGKSTLMDLILGLTQPECGHIFIDDKFPPHSFQWHKKIGYVPQNTYLTDDTIAANIAFGEEKDAIDDKRLQKACQDAQLSDLLDKLGEGVQTIVGERGIRLSGGEKQRIAIARALYRNPEVLIFDEATSALDNETEKKLMATMESVSQNRTVIMIAHRLTTLKNCDRIIALKDGCIDKITTYDAL